jgi:hypothetical protein
MKKSRQSTERLFADGVIVYSAKRKKRTAINFKVLCPQLKFKTASSQITIIIFF